MPKPRPRHIDPVANFKQDITFSTKLRDKEMYFLTTWGLFSPRRLDDGSRMLINKIELESHHNTLDLGCGYGPVGLAIARDCPDGQVHLVDKDFVAVQYATKNAARNGLDNCHAYLSNAFSAVPDMKFDNVVSNLPANVGREMLEIILNDAKSHLVDGGKLYVVTIAGLKKFIKRNFIEVFGNYDKLKQGKTYTVSVAVNDS